MKDIIKKSIRKTSALLEKLSLDATLIDSIDALIGLAQSTLGKGGKVILFGNGGSASDSQHIAAELVGRFSRERKALAAIALTCNSSNITSIGNDFGFEYIFSRQIEGIAKKEDLAIGISTSGTSVNVLTAISKAKEMGLKTAALTSSKNSTLADAVDVAISVDSKETPNIQEAHIVIGHIFCQLLDTSEILW